MIKRVAADPCTPLQTVPALSGIENIVVDRMDLFETIACDMPAGYRDSADDLRNRLKQGCVLFIARQHQADRRRKIIVGYSIGERGVFSALDRRREIPRDVLFAHYVEVLPAFAGKKVYQTIDAIRNDYCRTNGVKKICSVVLPRNIRSLQAVTKVGFVKVGVIQRVSILQGLFVWETPWRAIEEAIVHA